MVAPGNRFTRRYRLLDWDHRQPQRVDWVSGACFLARRDAWDAVGGFDPAYFMYMEDVDLCWRLARAGWGVGYEPGAEVIHVQGVSTNQHPYRMLAAHHRSMWRFARRTTVGHDRAVLPLVAVGLAARLVVATVRHGLGRDPAPSRLSGPGRPLIGPGDRYPERRYGQGFFEQEGGARRRDRRRPYAPGAHPVDVLQRHGRRGDPRDPGHLDQPGSPPDADQQPGGHAADRRHGLERGVRRVRVRQVRAGDHPRQEPQGITTGDGDGIIHIHPTTKASAGKNATLGKFASAAGMKLNAGELQLPGGKLYLDGDSCQGKPGHVYVKEFAYVGRQDRHAAERRSPQRPAADQSLLTIAFVPASQKDSIPPPPQYVINNLNKLAASSTTSTTTATPTTAAAHDVDDGEEEVRAVVLVGGEGTRLRPLTLTTPKQMLPIGGRPMIERVLGHLAQHGIDEVGALARLPPRRLSRRLPRREVRRRRRSPTRWRRRRSTPPGAIRFAARQAGIAETFVVVNGDVLTSLDVTGLVAFHRERGAEATIALTPVPNPSAFGVVPTDDAGSGPGFHREAPARAGADQPDQRRDLRARAVGPGPHPRRPAGLDRAGDLPGSGLRPAPLRPGLDGGLGGRGDARQLPRRQPPLRHGRRRRGVGGTLTGPGARVITSVLGRDVTVGAGAVVEGSVLFSGVTVGPGAEVRSSIVGSRGADRGRGGGDRPLGGRRPHGGPTRIPPVGRPVAGCPMSRRRPT